MHAQYNLGGCYENGIGTAKNAALALDYYRKSAAQGFEKAKENLKRLGAQ